MHTERRPSQKSWIVRLKEKVPPNNTEALLQKVIVEIENH